MILQALTDYYKELAKKGKIARPGWGKVKVSFALILDEDGKLTRILPLSTTTPDGKKSMPQELELPIQFKRSGSNAPSYFLCDNSQYCLGIEKGIITDKSKKCFLNFANYHRSILGDSNSPLVKAFLKFVNSWDPEKALDNKAVQDTLSLIEAGGNFVFAINEPSIRLHEDKEITDLWNRLQSAADDGNKGVCLITGQNTEIARIHNSVKGIQTSALSPNGWTLVGFDKDAFCSYGKEQSYNAPVGKYAAFAYTTALNTLLADKDHVLRLGDTTVVFWAQEAQPAYQTSFGSFFSGDGMSDDELKGCMKALAQGRPHNFDGVTLMPNEHFYVLGLAPNAARLSVRFFLRDRFGAFAQNLQRHYDDIRVIGNNRSKFEDIPLWALLRETVNMNSRNKDAVPQMAGDTLRAVLSGTGYPATLYQQTQLRIRAESEVTRGRAGIIKAYLTRMQNNDKYREALTVELNEQTKYQPYVLGRLFSVLEGLQQAANPGINATITDKFFTSAGATPGIVFPRIINLSKNHLKKLDVGMRTYYSKQITELMGMISRDYPAHYNLYEQGIFQLGYYHQTQKRYEKKDRTAAAETLKEEN